MTGRGGRCQLKSMVGSVLARGVCACCTARVRVWWHCGGHFFDGEFPRSCKLVGGNFFTSIYKTIMQLSKAYGVVSAPESSVANSNNVSPLDPALSAPSAPSSVAAVAPGPAAEEAQEAPGAQMHALAPHPESLSTLLAELRNEIERLRRQQRRSTQLGWVVLAAIALVIVVALAMTASVTQHMTRATEVLAWSCGRNMPAAPHAQ